MKTKRKSHHALIHPVSHKLVNALEGAASDVQVE